MNTILTIPINSPQETTPAVAVVTPLPQQTPQPSSTQTPLVVPTGQPTETIKSTPPTPLPSPQQVNNAPSNSWWRNILSRFIDFLQFWK